jgi:hypothetical protein
MVDPSAISKRPGCRASAPVKAPFSRPNSSDSIKLVGSAAQLTLTIGRSLRASWIACSVGFVARCRKCPTMRLDNQTTNGKTYSRSVGLCRKERLKYTVLVLVLYSNTSIVDGDYDTGGLHYIGAHSQHACAASAHRLYRVRNEIQKHLL